MKSEAWVVDEIKCQSNTILLEVVSRKDLVISSPERDIVNTTPLFNWTVI